MSIDHSIGTEVLAPVPTYKPSGYTVADTHYLDRNLDGTLATTMRRCTVERGPDRLGRLMLKVKGSKQDIDGNPLRVFAHPDELRYSFAGVGA